MKLPKYIVYGLKDPTSGALRYVGKSCSGRRRIIRHWAPSDLANDSNPGKKEWVSSLLAQGMKPEIVVLQEGNTPECLIELEVMEIERALDRGDDLLNILIKPANHIRQEDFDRWAKRVRRGTTGNTRVKQSEAMKKHYRENPEERHRVSKDLKKRWEDESYRKAHVKMMRERWADPEFKESQRRKLSKVAKNRGKQPQLEKIIAISKARSQPVLGTNIKTGETKIFASMKEAARECNTQSMSVVKCLRGQYSQTKGWRFELWQKR